MQKYKILLGAFIVFSASLFIFSQAALADDTLITDEIVQAVIESATLASEAETLDGVEIAEPTKIPSGIGLWWQSLRESVALGLTLNPVKKAEKQLQFAAERTKLAEYMIENSEDAKVQEKALRLLERASEYTQKIEERENSLTENGNQEKVQVLLRNAAKHQINTQYVFEKLEDKLPAEKLEDFQQWRQEAETRQQQFLEKLEIDFFLPQEIKDKATEVKLRIQETLQEREEFRLQQKEILDEIKDGKQEAVSALEQLREERRQVIQQAQEQYKETKTEIIDKINSGEEGAVKELLRLNEARKAEIEEIQQEIKNKATEIRIEVRSTIQENQRELQQNQNRVEQRTQAGQEAQSSN